MKLFHPLTEAIRSQLAHIEPTVISGVKYFPCSAYTISGQLINCVYIVEADGYHRHWGVWPEDDKAKQSLSITEISSIAESAYRLPPQHAKKIYAGGESGMGYHVFTVRFKNGIERKYVGGGAVDFITYPNGLRAQDIADVSLHATTEGQLLSPPTYYWCLYSDNSQNDAVLKMARLDSNSDLYNYLSSLAKLLEGTSAAPLAAHLYTARDQAAGLSTECLGESLIALRKIIAAENGVLKSSEREELVRVIRQVEFALKR